MSRGHLGCRMVRYQRSPRVPKRPRQASRTGAFLCGVLEMDQSMDHATFGVKATNYPVEEACIAMLVASPNRPGKQVGNLDETRCRRFQEQRHLGEVAQVSPSRAFVSKVPGQYLKCPFVVGVVHYNQTAIPFALSVPQSRKEQIEAIADLFECTFYGIVRRNRLLVDDHREGLDARVRVPQKIKAVLDRVQSPSSGRLLSMDSCCRWPSRWRAAQHRGLRPCRTGIRVGPRWK